MALPFAPEKAGDNIILEGVILREHQRKGQIFEYNLYLPHSISSVGNTTRISKNYELTSKDWAEWLKHSDDPTFTQYTDETRNIVKAIIRKGTRQVDQDVVWATYRRDNFTCRYCGAKDRPLTYDHYVAQAFGGPWTLENGRTACRPCNKKKANKTVAEWEEEMKQWKRNILSSHV